MDHNGQNTLQIDSIFPQSIGVARGIYPSDDEIVFLKNQKFCDSVGNYTSVNLNLLDAPELIGLRNTLFTYLQTYFETVYRPEEYTQITITQSWLNFSKYGQYHHFHCHPNSIISGCLYIRADKDHHSIDFYRMDADQIFIQSRENTTSNSIVWNYPVENGQLILFPSRLYHSAPVNKVKGERISLAFNTFVTGVLGARGAPTELKLTV